MAYHNTIRWRETYTRVSVGIATGQQLSAVQQWLFHVAAASVLSHVAQHVGEYFYKTANL